MAKKTNRLTVILKNPETGSVYYTSKNSVNEKTKEGDGKIRLKKYDRKINKVAEFVEASKQKFD